MERAFGKLVGGRHCLDFVNTVSGRLGRNAGGGARGSADRVVGERLVSYDALLRWATVAGVLTNAHASALRRSARARPGEASAVLERSLLVREAMYRVFKAAVEKWPARPADLAVLNRELHTARAHERLVESSSRFGWKWDATPGALDSPLWPVVRSAAELLTSPDLARIGRCPGPECGWLFLDTSRSHRRQWCDMADCGNVAKVRRFRQRLRHAR